ncbi:MAG: serine protease [Treponema sp.]|nr:serine protease [Treponema sp.]
MKRAVFLVFCVLALAGLTFGQSLSFGTGFFINDSGVIITCAHVIEDGEKITVKIAGTEYPAQILNTNTDMDLAVIKINYRNSNHFKIADFANMNLGDKISVMGYPLPTILSSDIRYTEGTLSAKSGLKADAYYFQHSAPMQPGNSGGPILNSRFEVIGVAAAVIDDTVVKKDSGLIPQNINFGIKSDYIAKALGSVKPGNGNVFSITDAEKATVQILCYYPDTQAPVTVTVINNTGYEGWYLYITPVSEESWGPDRLGDGVLKDGQSVTIADIPASSDGRYDLNLVDKDDDSYTKWNIRIASGQKIEFTFDDFDYDSQETVTYNGPPVTIVNNTGYVIYYVYISPSDEKTWGKDRLGSDQIMGDGEYVTLNLPQPLNVVSEYDIRVKDSDGDTYTKYNVILRANGRVVFTFDDFD